MMKNATAKSIDIFVARGSICFNIDSPERKIKLGTTLPIALIIGIIFGAIFLTVQIGVITGLIIGVIATFIWELIEKNKGGRSS